jgi:starvation-inducible DNA-binding protein
MPVAQTVPNLQAALVDLIDIGLLAKQAHWNVHGANFRSVHLELDEVNDSIQEWVDTVAERISAVGGHPDGRAATVAATSKVADIDGGAIEAGKVVAIFAERLDATARRLEARLVELDADLPSQDVLIEVVQGLDKAAWFWRAQDK